MARFFVAALAAMVACTGMVDAHSYLLCVNSPSVDKCNGFPRQFFHLPDPNFQRNSAFGFEYMQYGQTVRHSIQPGHAPFRTIAEMYNSQYPMTKAFQGQTLNLVWPSNNHKDPAGLPSEGRFVQIYMNPTPQDIFTTTQNDPFGVEGFLRIARKVGEFKFGNDNFNTARACSVQPMAWYAQLVKQDRTNWYCNGRFTVPNDIPDGVYSFMWYWSWRPDISKTQPPGTYTTAFEIEVRRSFNRGGTLPTPSPSPRMCSCPCR